MRELLKRWAQLQPSRCNMRTETLGPALVTLGGYGHYYWGGPASDAVVLAATIEAIEAHKGRFTLKRDIGDGHYFAAVRFPSQKTPRSAKAYQPAAALLLAYLAALEAEGGT